MAEMGLVISHLFQKAGAPQRRLAEAAGCWSFRNAPEPGWLAGKPKRRIFHWGLGPVLDDFKKAFLREGLDRYLAENDIELFSFDLGPSAGRHLSILPLSRPLGREAIFQRTDSALAFVRRHYRGPLAAENYNFYPTGLYQGVTEPDFMRSYLDEFGLGLVLDLAHAAVTAHNTGRRADEYFEALPLQKTVELHLSRPFLPPDSSLMAVDAHQAPGLREWGWLEALLKKKAIALDTPVFIEYYRSMGGLEKAQARLAEIVGA